jgi:hypothetical protein
MMSRRFTHRTHAARASARQLGALGGGGGGPARLAGRQRVHERRQTLVRRAQLRVAGGVHGHVRGVRAAVRGGGASRRSQRFVEQAQHRPPDGHQYARHTQLPRDAFASVSELVRAQPEHRHQRGRCSTPLGRGTREALRASVCGDSPVPGACAAVARAPSRRPLCVNLVGGFSSRSRGFKRQSDKSTRKDKSFLRTKVFCSEPERWAPEVVHEGVLHGGLLGFVWVLQLTKQRGPFSLPPR